MGSFTKLQQLQKASTNGFLHESSSKCNKCLPSSYLTLNSFRRARVCSCLFFMSKIEHISHVRFCAVGLDSKTTELEKMKEKEKSATFEPSLCLVVVTVETWTDRDERYGINNIEDCTSNSFCQVLRPLESVFRSSTQVLLFCWSLVCWTGVVFFKHSKEAFLMRNERT